MIKTDNKIMIERIKSLMDTKGMNARKLAEKATVGKSFVYDILSGKSTNPTSARLLKICNALHVPISYLVKDQDLGPYDHFDCDNYVPISQLNESNNCGNTPPQLFLHVNMMHAFFKDNENLSLYKVACDSMEPTLNHGDTVLIDTAIVTPYPSGVFVIKDSVGCSVKRIEYLVNNKDKIRIISDNSKYKEYECSIDEIQIIGKIVWFSRNF